MPINRTTNTIFVHIPKTGGTSIEKALGMYSNWRKTNLNVLYGLDKDKKVLQSLCLEYYKNYLPEKLISQCKIYTVVRNPYDRALSDFSWKNRGFDNLKDYLQHIKNTLSKKTKSELMVFNKNLQNHYLPQFEYIKSEKYKVTHILRFENLNKEFEKHFPTIKLEYHNKSKHEDYKEFYKKNPECVDLVNEIYNIDFVKFNYKKLFR